MKKFTEHTGVAVPLLRVNIDTDAIIPSREMKRVSKCGLSDGLFAGWRYRAAGSRDLNPEFVLNQAEYQGASIILSGNNFGCGSSREHAVWALKEFGIRAIIASGFGSIFYGNCIRNGLLPIVLPDKVVHNLAEQVSLDPQRRRVKIDLRRKLVLAPDDSSFKFSIGDSQQQMLLEGLDPIALTLQLDDKIQSFQEEYRRLRPWLF